LNPLKCGKIKGDKIKEQFFLQKSIGREENNKHP